MAHGTLLNAMCQPRWQGGLGEDGYMCCVWLSPFGVHLRLPATLFIGYAPIQNKKFKI